MTSLDADNNSNNPVAVDDDDHDSAFGDNQSSFTTSVTPSVFEFRYEHGRRYHAYSDRKYPIPNDEIEKDRLDLQHHAFRLTLDGNLYRAPIRNDIQHVLDVGTGTGIWAIEFCDLHPSAQVIGTDLSPIQPEAVPPNCSFLIDDCEQEWLFHHEFDFIHTRAMVAAIKDWSLFFRQAYANLVPGGYLELQEIPFPAMCMDTSLTPEASPLLRWSSLFIEAAAQIGVDATAPLAFGQKLRDIGFVDVKLKVYRWPVGQWAKGEKWKSLGKFAHEDLMDWLSSGSLGLFTRVLGWSRERLELFLAEVRKELKVHKERHFYAHVMMWYARKPRKDEQWNATADAYTLEESIELVVDEEDADTGEGAGINLEPLKSPGILVTSTAGLTLAMASMPTTPNESERDSSETSTIHTAWDKFTANPEVEENTIATKGTPGFSHTVQHTHDDIVSAPTSPKTPRTTGAAASSPPPLSLRFGDDHDKDTDINEESDGVKGKERIDSTVQNAER